jgi:Na+/H+ antiporter NhaD/arsenite permease-like protein
MCWPERPDVEEIKMRKIVKGTLLGTLIFFAGLFYAVYGRSIYGLPAPFFGLLIAWKVLVVYLVMCLVAGCLLYLVGSFVVHRIFRRPKVKNASFT